MTRRAILQIGTEKTGTTTLQHFLAANRATLLARGHCYPRFCGQINHTGLAAFALDPAKPDALREPFGGQDRAGIAAMRDRMRLAAARELTGDETAIFCNEHCHSRLTTRAEIETLRDFLRPHFDDIRISVYLRRQDQVALSLYSTRLKSGGTDPTILPRTHAADPFFNYDVSLALWEQVFGAANIKVRLFDRALLAGGSITTDFVTTWSLGAPEEFTTVRDQNESINPAAQEFLRRLNPALEAIGSLAIEETRGPLAARLAQAYPGRGARPSRAEAEAFYAMFQSSNEAVRARHFPERATLFDEDFSGYPETADPREVTLDAFAEIAARLHNAATAEARRLEAEIAIRDARLHWHREEREQAEAALRRALRWHPDHADAWRLLGEYLGRMDRCAEAAEAAWQALRISPRNAEFWHFLGVILRRTRDFTGAADAQARVLALSPDHPGATREIAQIRVKLTETETRRAASGG